MTNLRWPYLIFLGIMALVVVIALDVLIGTTVTPRLIPRPTPTHTLTPTPTPTIPPPQILKFELISPGPPQVVDTGERAPRVYRVYRNTDVTFQWQTNDATTVTFSERGSAPEEVSPNGHKYVWNITQDKTYVLKAKNATEISAQIQVQVVTPPHFLDSEDFTFVAWVYWEGGNDWQRIFDFGHDTTSYINLTPASDAKRLRFAITTSGVDGEEWLNADKPLDTDKWVHVAVTLAGDTGQLYVDGTSVASQTITLNPRDIIDASQRWLGKSQYDWDPTFKGKLDEVAVFDRALSQSEIQGVMASRWDGLPGQTLGLHMEEIPATHGTLIADSSGQGNDGNLYTFGNSTDNSSPGYLGRALYFDGVDDYVNLTLYAARTPYVRTLYVRPGGSGGCLSWTSACELQTALKVAEAGHEIWVAGGVYTPTFTTDATDPRTATFQLQPGVALYGGFPGDDDKASWDDRDWDRNITVLSGDIDGNDQTDANGVITTTDYITGSNVYHVVTGSNTDRTAILDGFTITGGRANKAYNEPCGYACGGGMYNEEGGPTLANVVFSGNHADHGGGGMFNHESKPVLTATQFVSNTTKI